MNLNNYNITKKQYEILTLLFRFRFLNTTHIQSFLHHQDKRRINHWLKDLTEQKYLKRFYDKKIIGVNRIPAIYFLAPLGIRILKAHNNISIMLCRKRYYDKDRSDSFISHCLSISTICSELKSNSSEIKKYEYFTFSDLEESDNSFHFLTDTLHSIDLMYKKTEKRKKTKYYLLTIFDETLPKYRMRKRLRDYYAFYLNNEWEDTQHTPFPTLFFVCETKALMISAKRYFKQLKNSDVSKDFKVYFAISKDVKDLGVSGPIWEEG